MPRTDVPPGTETTGTAPAPVDAPPAAGAPPGETNGPAAAPAPPPAFAGTTTTAVRTPFPPAAACSTPPAVSPPVSLSPSPEAQAFTDTLAALDTAGAQVSASVHVDGLGDLAAKNPTVSLAPASNEKLIVAVAVLEALPTEDRLTTTVIATGPVADGVLHGDLILVGGGDPDLARFATQSVDSLGALADQLHARGITHVQGRLVVDESRYDSQRAAPGWDGALWQSNVGPLTALMVNHEKDASSTAYLADPALGNGWFFRGVLHNAGIDVEGAVEHGVAPPGQLVASVSSMKLRELVADMLTKSDNLTAEALTKELGYRLRGAGTTVDGLAAARTVLAGLCVDLAGIDADGSGLSSVDRRTTASLLRLLEVAKTRPWWPVLRDALPLAGRSGTLTSRLLDPATAGNVRAKTGSTFLARALSGYLRTAAGRDVEFSIIVGTPGPAAEAAIDAVVVALARLP